jgi:hypothetical protein
MKFRNKSSLKCILKAVEIIEMLQNNEQFLKYNLNVEKEKNRNLKERLDVFCN